MPSGRAYGTEINTAGVQKMAEQGKTCLVAMIGLVAGLMVASPAWGASVWIEGEDANISMVLRGEKYEKVKKSELSAGDWIHHSSSQRQGVVDYRFDAVRAGDYAFWLRATPIAGAFTYRVNSGDWMPVDVSEATDSTNIASDGASEQVVISWLNLGNVPLRAGSNKIVFRISGDENNKGAIDALMFTTDDLTPVGKDRPEGMAEQLPVPPSPQGTWAFQPGVDTYSPNALLDLRDLNERQAGEHGFIQRSEDGADFLRGDGEPIRFWAANTGIWSAEDPRLMDDHARFLAKRGVNMVRWHGNITPKKEGATMTDFDAVARERLWRGVAAFKKAGIYVTASPYWSNSCNPQPHWPVPRRGGKDMHALLFFDPVLQDAYKGWLRAIYDPINPHTGVALKDEPAIAVIQLQNEDSLLFWTINNLKGQDLDVASRQYSEWLAEKYGSLAEAQQTWQRAQVQGDDPARGLMRFYNIWEMTQPQQAGSGKDMRLSDQLQFWTETMHEFNSEIERFLRDEVGCRQLINAGNWKTADPVRLEDCERYSYTANQVIAVNRYVGDTHLGEHRGWAIVNGDRFEDRSVLIRPHMLATNVKQPVGYPFIITESSWVPPLSYQSEGPFLISVFKSLTGVDSYYWFSFGAQATRRPQWPNSPHAQWRQPSSANGYLPSIGKWTADTPEVLGNFPAAALMFRKGYVERGETVVRENRQLQDMWDRRVPIIAETASYDPNRDRGDYAPESSVKADVNRLAFLVGPVEVDYDADPAGTRVVDLAPYIDERSRTVRSVTGQVRWDYGRGICTVNAPKAQGVTGFLNRIGTFELDDVTIVSGNDYATVLLVSMDDKPLNESGRILVQVGTRTRPTGWRERPVKWEDDEGNVHEGFEVVDFGRAPWQVIPNSVSLALANSTVTTATAVGMNGMARGEVRVDRSGDRISFVMRPDVKYVVLQ